MIRKIVLAALFSLAVASLASAAKWVRRRIGPTASLAEVIGIFFFRECQTEAPTLRDMQVSFQQAILLLTLASQCVPLVRMWRNGLTGRYPFFTAFLAAQSLQVAVLLLFDLTTRSYGILYYISSPLIWLLAYFVVLELTV